MCNKDLKIKIVNNLSKTQQVFLYLNNLQLRGSMIGAWAYPRIAPKANYEFVLPEQIMISAATSIGPGSMVTQEFPVSPDSYYEIFENDGVLDLRECSKPYPQQQRFIKVTNLSKKSRNVIISQGGRPIVAFEVLQNFVSLISLRKTLGVSIGSCEVQNQFFVHDQLPSNPVLIDYEGKSNLTIQLEEDAGDNVATIHYTLS